MSAAEEIVAIGEALARIEKKIDALSGKAKSAPVVVPDGAVAPDSELDGKYGDPVLKKSPPRWDGRDLAGKRYSDLTPPELECLIGFLVWKAEKNASEGTEDGKKYAGYATKDAARARGWLKRKQAGWKPPPDSDAALFSEPSPDDDIPF